MVLARGPNPIPSRTRPLNSSAPMVLSLKTWESRSLPGQLRTGRLRDAKQMNRGLVPAPRLSAGWSSPVARQAHNLKVVGSNPTPATNIRPLSRRLSGRLYFRLPAVVCGRAKALPDMADHPAARSAIGKCFSFLRLSHFLVGKPVSTFPGNALIHFRGSPRCRFLTWRDRQRHPTI